MNGKLEILDVRTKEEHILGHIPGAISLELFDSDERAKVGCMYKDRGRDDAVKLGFEIVNPKIDKLIREIDERIHGDKLVVHCWRGGMRSASVAWLIGLSLEKEVYILEGGYKAYRNFVLDTFENDYQYVILGGYTGSGKTEVLDELRRSGEQIVDLEAIAKHRGSAFGGIGLETQPRQQVFENILAEELLKLDPRKIIWLEDESRRIGSRTVPLEMFTKMKKAPLYFLNIPFDQRIDHLMKSYGTFEANQLLKATAKLERRLGLENKKIVEDLIANDRIRDACKILLRYYDKSYEHGLSKKTVGKIDQVPCESLTARQIADCLLDLQSK